VTIVDFRATWCPPCIGALPALSELQVSHEGELQIIGVAIESPEADVERIARRFELPFAVALGSPELAVQFGDLVAVPTAFVFDRGGKLVRTFYGAPPS
jgi:thiol-disulfide isomerase/thioredoxin